MNAKRMMVASLMAVVAGVAVTTATQVRSQEGSASTAAGGGDKSVYVEGKFATVKGIKLFYREAGDPKAPAIVLLHGTPASSYMFRNVLPVLGARFHVIAPDYPGFGYSDQPDAKGFKYSFDNLAAHVDALLEQKGVAKYALFVQDYGGPVGMRIATAHPERVTGLIFQNANLYEEGLLRPAWDPIIASWKGRTAQTDAGVAGFFGPEGIKFQYTHGMQDASRVAPDAWNFDSAIKQRPGNLEVELELASDYHTNPEHYPAWQKYLRERQPPVLVVWGRNDPFFGTVTPERIVKDVPKAEVHVYETSHFALEEEWPAISEEVGRFMGRVGG
jgi:pimeloyl-ACP methyl ester carboxylesterase